MAAGQTAGNGKLINYYRKKHWIALFYRIYPYYGYGGKCLILYLQTGREANGRVRRYAMGLLSLHTGGIVMFAHAVSPAYTLFNISAREGQHRFYTMQAWPVSIPDNRGEPPQYVYKYAKQPRKHAKLCMFYKQWSSYRMIFFNPK